MNGMLKMATGFAMLVMALGGSAQTKSERPVVASSEARYYKLTLNLTFGASGDQQVTTQTITTEFALRGAIAGACKARMVSQTPAGSGVQTKYIEVGTKFDANEIHLEGDGVAMHFVLSASRPVKMISYVASNGRTVEEPVITDRTVELSVKVPLDKPKVVFDSSSKSLAPLRPLGSSPTDGPDARVAANLPQADQPMVVEIAVSELK